MFVWPYVRLHILCMQLVICLLLNFIHIWYLGWSWSEHAHIPISQIVYFCESYSPFHVCLTICASHILCTQLVICLLSHFIHIWYLDWPWSEHVHIVLISRMVYFCESYSPFHVCLTIHVCPSAHLVYATSHLSFVAFYSYLVSWLAMIWACAYYTDFTDGWFLQELKPFSCLFDHMSVRTSCGGITARQRVQFHFSSSIMAQILNSKWLFASNSPVFVLSEWLLSMPNEQYFSYIMTKVF